MIEYSLSFILHVLRNPYGYTETVRRIARLEAANMLECLVRESSENEPSCKCFGMVHQGDCPKWVLPL